MNAYCPKCKKDYQLRGRPAKLASEIFPSPPYPVICPSCIKKAKVHVREHSYPPTPSKGIQTKLKNERFKAHFGEEIPV